MCHDPFISSLGLLTTRSRHIAGNMHKLVMALVGLLWWLYKGCKQAFSPWIRRRHVALWSYAKKAPRSVHMPVSMPMWWIVKCGVVKLKVQAGRFSRQKCTARIPDTYARNSMHRCEWIRKDMTEGSAGAFSKLGESTVMCIDQVYKWSKLFFITS